MRVVVPVFLAIAVGLLGPDIQAGQAAPSAAELAARLQKRYESIRDFTADFTQTYRGALIRKPTTERGKMWLKKPNRVRFNYDGPEKKVFASDGAVFKSYYPDGRTGSVYPLPKEDESSTALMFLAGRGNLARDFTPSIAAGAPAGEWHLGLLPKTKQTDFDTLTLFIDAKTLALLGFVTTDTQGTNTIRFSNLKENPGVADSAFVFEFPKGTVITK